MKTRFGCDPSSPSSPHRTSYRERGFALVASLMLMTLIVVVAISLLTLSSTSLSTATRESDLAEARANARVALAMAIAQIQKHTGPDQRVTVAADQLSSGGNGSSSSAATERRHWTGVYRSWRDTEAARPDPEFLSWLVSGESLAISDRSAAVSGGGGGELLLVGEGTLGNASESYVRVPALGLDTPSGGTARLAWWTGDQGMKAAMATPPPLVEDALASVRGGLQAAPRNAVELAEAGAAKPFAGLDLNDPRVLRVTGWKQSGFLAEDVNSPRELFHDLAPFSTGLLTNVRAGGFRKDLSMALERTSGREPRTALYTVGGETGINFQELWAYYNLHKTVKTRGRFTFTTGQSMSTNAYYLEVASGPAQCQADDSFYFKQPVIISYQMVVSLEVLGNQLRVVADPILTFWNPLDVPVVVPVASFFSIKYWQVPYTLHLRVNGTERGPYPLVGLLSGANLGSSGDYNYLTLQAGRAQQLIFKPGEVIKVSQRGIIRKTETQGADHQLPGQAGFNYGGGVSLPVKDSQGKVLTIAPSDVITYELRPNQYTAGSTGPGGSGTSLDGSAAHSRHFSLTHHEYYIGPDRDSNHTGQVSLGIGGMYIDWDFGNRRLRPNEDRGRTPPGQPGTKPAGQRTQMNALSLSGRYKEIFPAIEGSDTRPLTAAQLQEKQPLMIVSYNAKTEMGSDTGTRYLSRFNPRALHVDFYDMTPEERAMLPYEFKVEPLNSWRNRSLEVSQNGNAYFGGGMNAEFGSHFVTTHSVPREPIVSLAAFQHSFANGFEMQKPKYGYAALNAREPLLPQISHAIGNSMAPPILAPDRTEGSIAGGRPVADHSYLANRALWDDWFFSGIAPQMATTFATRRAQRVIAEEFFNGTADLPVVRYRSDVTGEDPGQLLSSFFSGSNPTDRATEMIASLIRVDGLFNVNSTSVEAWKAVLGSLKGRRVVVRDLLGAESIDSRGDLTPVSNLHAPQNMVADGVGSVDVKDEAQWVGRRELSDEEIDQLAQAIVREVRKRGPFLSLADFVNRRVGNDKDLARAGAIQSALDSNEVRINDAYRRGTRGVSNPRNFAFPEAEEGPAGYGMPGIVKQADILTPIAPVLSVRSDSFIIRAYGESVDRDGNVLARAWCEAVVERSKRYLDEEDEPETNAAGLRREANRAFGRRYEVISFRWLHPGDV